MSDLWHCFIWLVYKTFPMYCLNKMDRCMCIYSDLNSHTIRHNILICLKQCGVQSVWYLILAVNLWHLKEDPGRMVFAMFSCWVKTSNSVLWVIFIFIFLQFFEESAVLLREGAVIAVEECDAVWGVGEWLVYRTAQIEEEITGCNFSQQKI